MIRLWMKEALGLYTVAAWLGDLWDDSWTNQKIKYSKQMLTENPFFFPVFLSILIPMYVAFSDAGR